MDETPAVSSSTDVPLISPKALAIADSLTERIVTGRYANDSWFPTERELVEEFGVSRTVIRGAVEALEHRGLILRSPRCRTLVQKSMSPTFPPMAMARRTLGLWIWPSSGDPTAYELVSGIYQSLDHNAFRLVVGNACGDNWGEVLRSEMDFLERIASDQDIAGVILWHLGGEKNLPALNALRAANIPLIFIDRCPPQGFDADFVGVDNEHAAETIVRHLIALGHRQIAHITNMDQASTVSERMRGYRRALEAAGLPFRPELVVMQREPKLPDETQEEVFGRMAADLLSLPNPATAVFGVNDVVALRLIEALRAGGLNVPQAISVAGFDGIERWHSGKLFLTTANQPFERIGRRAVDLLLHRLDSGSSAPYRQVFLEAPLSIHNSTGMPSVGIQSLKSFSPVESTKTVLDRTAEIATVDEQLQD